MFYGRDTLLGGIEKVCRQAQERRELLEFCTSEEGPLSDLHWVVEHPKILSKRLLSRIARRVPKYSPSEREER
jgi:hypothetical protein